jgi:hypothetical protein
MVRVSVRFHSKHNKIPQPFLHEKVKVGQQKRTFLSRQAPDSRLSMVCLC